VFGCGLGELSRVSIQTPIRWMRLSSRLSSARLIEHVHVEFRLSVGEFS